jgi:cob(I)alamin adenosyltransferase
MKHCDQFRSRLYTGKGDGGTTKVIDSKERFSKASILAETLGSLDELNAFLGFCKMRAQVLGEPSLPRGKKMVPISAILREMQENLFILQAEVAGAKKKLTRVKVSGVETRIAEVEAIIPPITAFSIAGGTELSAMLDVARTIARRTERRLVEVHQSELRKVGEHSRAYANRLSSLLFALARFVNHAALVKEESPQYR